MPFTPSSRPAVGVVKMALRLDSARFDGDLKEILSYSLGKDHLLATVTKAGAFRQLQGSLILLTGDVKWCTVVVQQVVDHSCYDAATPSLPPFICCSMHRYFGVISGLPVQSGSCSNLARIASESE